MVVESNFVGRVELCNAWAELSTVSVEEVAEAGTESAKLQDKADNGTMFLVLE